MVGKNWSESCIAPKDRLRVTEVFFATAHGAHTSGVVNDVCGKHGRTLTIRWSNTVLKKPGGKHDSILAVAVDISDFAEAQARALQAERLVAIGETMAAIAHESRNALQRIQAASDVLALEIAGNKDAEEDLSTIRRAGSDLERLLEELRSFAAPIQIHPTTTYLPNIWKRVWADITASRKGRDAELVPPRQINLNQSTGFAAHRECRLHHS